jgi:hypothetical protein
MELAMLATREMALLLVASVETRQEITAAV